MEEIKEREKKWWNENTDDQDELKKPYRNKWETMHWRKQFSMIISNYNFSYKKIFVGCCGTGIFEEAIAKYEPTVQEIVGLDLTPKFIKLARIRNLNNKKAEFIEGDLETLDNFKSGYFDVAVIIDGLHHIPRPFIALNNLKRISHDIILFEPNAFPLRKQFIELRFRNQGVKESAFYEWQLIRWLKRLHYSSIKIVNTGFIPQYTPKFALGFVENTEKLLENIPIIKKLGGAFFVIGKTGQ